MPKTIVFPYPFKEQCDMALCDKPKKYTIATEGSHPSLFFGICEYHMDSLIDAIIDHPELGPKIADKLATKGIKKLDSRPDRSVVPDVPDQTDQDNKNTKQKKIPFDKDMAICPYCNKQFKSNELRDHMKKCNIGGEHC